MFGKIQETMTWPWKSLKEAKHNIIMPRKPKNVATAQWPTTFCSPVSLGQSLKLNPIFHKPALLDIHAILWLQQVSTFAFMPFLPSPWTFSHLCRALRSGQVERLGLGVDRGQLTEEEDEFSTYRKRMMLSYKFRPNPMKNPRRDYY